MLIGSSLKCIYNKQNKLTNSLCVCGQLVCVCGSDECFFLKKISLPQTVAYVYRYKF